MKSLYLILISLLLSSCGLFSANESTAYIKSKQYENSFQNNLPHPWVEIKSEGSDFAIRNTQTNSILLLNSACRKSEGSSLNALSSAILTGIDDITIISKNNLALFEREAIEVRVSGKVDGVKTFFNIMTTQKNYCIYDYVLIASSLKKLENDYGTFKNFINGIKPQ